MLQKELCGIRTSTCCSQGKPQVSVRAMLKKQAHYFILSASGCFTNTMVCRSSFFQQQLHNLHMPPLRRR